MPERFDYTALPARILFGPRPLERAAIVDMLSHAFHGATSRAAR